MRSKFAFMFCMVLLVFGMSSLVAHALPGIAAEYYGTVTTNGTAAAAGTVITVHDSSENVCGNFTMVNSGYYGLLSCQADDNSTGIDEGAIESETLTFRINGTLANATGNLNWSEGIFFNVNLSNYVSVAPLFDHLLTNLTINERDNLTYDINCTDYNEDNITYLTNSTFFDVDPETGIFEWTPINNETGTHDFALTCSDGLLNTTDVLAINVLNINFSPTLTAIGNRSMNAGFLFTYTLTGTDLDYDNLTFYSNSSIFVVNATTGEINFSPVVSQAGTYEVLFWVSDGYLNDSEIAFWTIVDPNATEGGEGEGEGGEGTEGTEGEGGSSTGEGGQVLFEPYVCREQYLCSSWDACQPDNTQLRNCNDLNGCGTEFRLPQTERACVYNPTCSDGIMNGDETGIDCGGSCGACFVPSQEPTCFDGIQNGDETGIDCGGSCEACQKEVKAAVALPFPVEVEELQRNFPWLFLLLMLLLILLIMLFDYLWVRYMRQQQLEVFRNRYLHYKQYRKLVYKSLIQMAILTIIVSIYSYYYSIDPESMKDNIPWLAILLGVTPFAVAYMLRRAEYHDYLRIRAEKMLKQLQRINQLFMKRVEDEILHGLEKRSAEMIVDLQKKEAFKGAEPYYEKVRALYPHLVNLYKQRDVTPLEMNKEFITLMKKIVRSSSFKKMAKNYREFMDLDELINNQLFDLPKKATDKQKESRIWFALSNMLLAIRSIKQDKLIQLVLENSSRNKNLLEQLQQLHDEATIILYPKEKDLSGEESEFSKGVRDLAGARETEGLLEAHPDLTSLHNSLVDLSSHYDVKKGIQQELSNLEQAEQNS